jgi:hypothetical protein
MNKGKGDFTDCMLFIAHGKLESTVVVLPYRAVGMLPWASLSPYLGRRNNLHPLLEGPTPHQTQAPF